MIIARLFQMIIAVTLIGLAPVFAETPSLAPNLPSLDEMRRKIQVLKHSVEEIPYDCPPLRDWLLRQQRNDDTWNGGAGPSDIDSRMSATALAAQALSYFDKRVSTRAWRWLLAMQNRDGSFSHNHLVNAVVINSLLTMVSHGKFDAEQNRIRSRLMDAVVFVVENQNASGGWPERYNGKGVDLLTTALLADAIRNAVPYLTDSQAQISNDLGQESEVCTVKGGLSRRQVTGDAFDRLSDFFKKGVLHKVSPTTALTDNEALLGLFLPGDLIKEPNYADFLKLAREKTGRPPGRLGSMLLFHSIYMILDRETVFEMLPLVCGDIRTRIKELGNWPLDPEPLQESQLWGINGQAALASATYCSARYRLMQEVLFSEIEFLENAGMKVETKSPCTDPSLKEKVKR